MWVCVHTSAAGQRSAPPATVLRAEAGFIPASESRRTGAETGLDAGGHIWDGGLGGAPVGLLWRMYSAPAWSIFSLSAGWSFLR